MIGTTQLDLIKAERKQWRENSILNTIAVQKLSVELDTVIKQKDELQEKLNSINKISIIENGKTNLAVELFRRPCLENVRALAPAGFAQAQRKFSIQSLWRSRSIDHPWWGR